MVVFLAGGTQSGGPLSGSERDSETQST